jgi:hypothetical protein
MSEHATSLAVNGEQLSNLVPYDDWLKSIGLDRGTGYRYRKAGILTAVNIFGRLYLTRTEIERFEKRALAGDFARKSAIQRLVTSTADPA